MLLCQEMREAAASIYRGVGTFSRGRVIRRLRTPIRAWAMHRLG